LKVAPASRSLLVPQPRLRLLVGGPHSVRTAPLPLSEVAFLSFLPSRQKAGPARAGLEVQVVMLRLTPDRDSDDADSEAN
jgi:hypothetical protein